MRVCVRSMAGECLAELELPTEADIVDLKAKVFERLQERSEPQWRLPAPFYHFVLGDQVLPAAGRLAEGAAEDEELAVTLVASLSALESDDEALRCEALLALDSLQALAREDGTVREAAFSAASGFFKDENAQIRRLALKVASEVAAPRDPRLLEAALERVAADGDVQVVAAALEVVSQAAVPGDPRCVDAVGACLATAQAKHGEDVLFSAIRALGAVAGRGGGARALAALRPALEHGSGYVRLVALDTLGIVASAEDELSLELLRGRLGDRESNMRRKSVELLPQLLPAVGGRAVELALPLLRDPAESVRCAALALLGKLAAKGSPEVLAAVCDCAGAGGAGVDVRCVALEVLAQLVEPPCEAALELARACAEDGEPDVRDAAAELLEALGAS